MVNAETKANNKIPIAMVVASILTANVISIHAFGSYWKVAKAKVFKIGKKRKCIDGANI